MKEILYGILAISVVITVFQLVHIIYVSTASPSSVEYVTSIRQLNSTLIELNSELKQYIETHKAEKAAAAIEISEPTIAMHASIATASVTKKSVEIEDKVNEMRNKTTKKTKKAVLFTMDSIAEYERNSLKGGAAGEIIVRKALQYALHHYNISLDIITSDEQFSRKQMSAYDIVLLDPWTWAAKGWIPKANIKGFDDRIYILDFFGNSKSKFNKKNGLSIAASRILTAFGTNGDSFLGYFIDNSIITSNTTGNTGKKFQGIIWGKDPKHFEGSIPHLKAIADGYTLVSTSTAKVFEHPNVLWLGHMSSNQWYKLLSESKFLIGMGHPLLGPSAIDCISLGCTYINPIYQQPVHGHRSQHQYTVDSIGNPRVCSYKHHDYDQLKRCVDTAIKNDLQPFVPPDFTKKAYLERVKKIFDL